MMLIVLFFFCVVMNFFVVVVFDYYNCDDVLFFVDKIDLCDCCLKVGKEMFILFGLQFVCEF